MRADRHHTQTKPHKCNFVKAQASIEDILTKSDTSRSVVLDEIAEFIATNNIPISTGSGESFRELLRLVYANGYRSGSEHPNGDIDLAFSSCCPPMKETSLRKRVVEVAALKKKELMISFKNHAFSAMTMDAGQVYTLKLFVTNLVISPLLCSFTYSIDVTDDLNCISLKNLIVPKLIALKQDEIHISAITCDGATYQRKALDFEDQDSIQNCHEEFSRLFFIPCLCHRLNNAYQHLFRECAPFHEIITSLRSLAVFCRKPAQRRFIGRVCPEFIQTRWLYDHRILTFVLANEEKINALPGPDHKVIPAFHAIEYMLGIFNELVTKLEGSSVPLCFAFPLIHDALQKLATRGSMFADHLEMSMLYDCAAARIRLYTLDSTNNLLQLAYILTPNGREHARNRFRQDLHLMPCSGQVPLERILRADSTSDGDIWNVLDEETGLREFALPLTLSHNHIVDHEDSEIVDNEEEEITSVEEDEPEPAEISMIGEEDEPIDNIVTVAIGPEYPHYGQVVARARLALEQIARQFKLAEIGIAELLAAFDNYVNQETRTLPVSPTLDGTRFTWISAEGSPAGFHLLSEIALRLEPATCSEALSERSLGQQRRYLAPHRLRTKPDLLLARTELDEISRRGKADKQGDWGELLKRFDFV
jgi:hypothetical protein